MCLSSASLACLFLYDMGGVLYLQVFPLQGLPGSRGCGGFDIWSGQVLTFGEFRGLTERTVCVASSSTNSIPVEPGADIVNPYKSSV